MRELSDAAQFYVDYSKSKRARGEDEDLKTVLLLFCYLLCVYLEVTVVRAFKGVLLLPIMYWVGVFFSITPDWARFLCTG